MNNHLRTYVRARVSGKGGQSSKPEHSSCSIHSILTPKFGTEWHHHRTAGTGTRYTYVLVPYQVPTLYTKIMNLNLLYVLVGGYAVSSRNFDLSPSTLPHEKILLTVTVFDGVILFVITDILIQSNIKKYEINILGPWCVLGASNGGSICECFYSIVIVIVCGWNRNKTCSHQSC